MTYISIGDLFLLAKRLPQKTQGQRIVLRFPADGILLVIGSDRFPIEHSTVALPLRVLREGENSLLFRKDGKEWRTEGILRRANMLSPCGISEEERFCALLDERQKLLARLDALEADVAAYARKALCA